MDEAPSGSLRRHADFLRLWGAQAGSAFGSRISRTALPIIGILTLEASPAEVAILAALSVAPGLLVGLFVGVHVDRARKRPLLIRADLVRAGLILTVPLVAYFGYLSMPQLYVVAALVGAATTVFQIADNAFLPVLVGREGLVPANARLEATEAVAEAGGPGLAGVLIDALTAPVAMLLDGLSYLWSAWLLGRIRTEEPEPAPTAPPASLRAELTAGFRAASAHPEVGALLLAEAVLYLFGGFFLALYMVLALQTLQLSPGALGLIISLGGVGAFAGALLAAPLERLFGATSAMVLALMLGQTVNLLIPLAPDLGSLAVPALVTQQLVGDAFMGAYLVHAVSLRQRAIDSALLGRVSAAFHVTAGALAPLGALIAGALATAVGVQVALWVGAWGGLLSAVVLAIALAIRRRF